MKKIKVVREFRLPTMDLKLVKYTRGEESLVYGVMMKNGRECAVGVLRLHSDGYYRPTAFRFDDVEEQVLSAARGEKVELYGDTTIELVEHEPQEPFNLVHFDAYMPEGNQSSFSLVHCQNGRWLPVLADLSMVRVSELRADGMTVPDGGFESVEQFREQLVKDGYTNLSSIEE